MDELNKAFKTIERGATDNSELCDYCGNKMTKITEGYQTKYKYLCEGCGNTHHAKI